MIAKIIHSGSFQNTLNYCIGKTESEILETSDFRITGEYSKEEESKKDAIRILTQEYMSTASASNLKNPCTHISLNFSKEERILKNEELIELAKDYLNEMGYYTNAHQYTIVRHNDSDHQHIHIIANKVNDYNKRGVRTNFERYKSKRISNNMEEKYDLIKSPREKSLSAKELKDYKTQNIYELDKYKLESLLDKAVNNSNTFEEYTNFLKDNKIKPLLRTTMFNREPIGIVYQMDDDFYIKSSQTKKIFSLDGLSKRFKDFDMSKFENYNEETNILNHFINAKKGSININRITLDYNNNEYLDKTLLTQDEYVFWESFKKIEGNLDKNERKNLEKEKTQTITNLYKNNFIDQEHAHKTTELVLTRQQIDELKKAENPNLFIDKLHTYQFSQMEKLIDYYYYKNKDKFIKASDKMNKKAKDEIINYIKAFNSEDEKKSVNKVKFSQKFSSLEINHFQIMIKNKASIEEILTQIDLNKTNHKNIKHEEIFEDKNIDLIKEKFNTSKNKKAFLFALKTGIFGAMINNSTFKEFSKQLDKSIYKNEVFNCLNFNKKSKNTIFDTSFITKIVAVYAIYEYVNKGRQRANDDFDEDEKNQKKDTGTYLSL